MPARQDNKIISKKLKRLINGESPRFMDLFAGCGGLTLGFLTAKFTPIASVELDKWAASTHGINFGIFSSGTKKELHHLARDIT